MLCVFGFSDQNRALRALGTRGESERIAFANPNHAAAAICALFPFCWGQEVNRGKCRTMTFTRLQGGNLDNICASLSVSDSGKGPALIRVVVELPEDFQVRNYKEKRRNGWQDPRLSEM